MKLIVGLGNPGVKYEKTRHNLGFTALDKFLKDFSEVNKNEWLENQKFKSLHANIEWQRQPRQKQKAGNSLEKVILLKPKTYMNNSGLPTRIVSDFYKIKPEDIWILHDDLDLPFGSLRIKFGGASAGHRGIESIMENLGTDKFWRFRLGIGHPAQSLKIKHQKSNIRDVADYVLSGFGHGEIGKARELMKKVVNALETGLESGLEVAMNRFNSK